MKLKICGMKYNPEEVAALRPEYLGFIFYEKSKRDFSNLEKVSIPESIQKVGVFVDADIAFAKSKIIQHDLDVVQLHGNESPEYIEELKASLQGEKNNTARDLMFWKVFGIKDSFEFTRLQPYEHLVDAFLFDTKGKEKGGNGYTFDWEVLKDYSSKKPIILSGGIGLDEIKKLKKIFTTDLPIMGLDINSKFEKSPGLKDIEMLEKFNLAMTGISSNGS